MFVDVTPNRLFAFENVRVFFFSFGGQEHSAGYWPSTVNSSVTFGKFKIKLDESNAVMEFVVRDFTVSKVRKARVLTFLVF